MEVVKFQTAGIIMGGNPAKKFKNIMERVGRKELPYQLILENLLVEEILLRLLLYVNKSNIFLDQWICTTSVDTYNNFSQNPTVRYLLTKKLRQIIHLDVLVVVQHQMMKISVVDIKDRVWQQEIY